MMNTANLDPDSHCAGGLPIPLTQEERLQWQERFNAWSVMRHFALRLDLSHPVATRFMLERIEPFHLGGVGDASKGGGHAVNGGVIACVFDGVLGVAGAVQLPGRAAATVDLSIKMFRPVIGVATAFGWAVKRSEAMVFVESVLVDGRGTRCAKASGIICAANTASQGERAGSHARGAAPAAEDDRQAVTGCL